MQLPATVLRLWLHSTQLKCFHVYFWIFLEAKAHLIPFNFRDYSKKKIFDKKNPFHCLLQSKSQLKDGINFKICSLIFLTHISGRKLCANWKCKCCLINWQHLFLQTCINFHLLLTVEYGLLQIFDLFYSSLNSSVFSCSAGQLQ